MRLSNKVRIKPGVSLHGVSKRLINAANDIALIYSAKFNAHCTITSGREGEHSENSKHYRGLALDFRTRHLSRANRRKLAEDVRHVLGDDFDVVLELTHMHVEYDPEPTTEA